MGRLIFFVHYIFFVVMLLFCSVFIQSVWAEKIYRHLDVESGLPSNRIYQSMEDRQGFMWFATENGLVRYDGYNFKIFKNIPGDSNSISGNYIWNITEMPDGRLWISVWGKGLSIFDPKTENFQRLTHNPDDSTSLGNNSTGKVIFSDDNQIWVMVAGGGINQYDSKTNSFTKILHDSSDPDSIPTNLIYKMEKSRDGRYLWVGMWDGAPGTGFFKFDTKTKKAIRLKNTTPVPEKSGGGTRWAFYEDEKQVLWIGNKIGLSRYDLKSEDFIRDGKYKKLDGVFIYDITQGPGNTLWIASRNKGVFTIDLDTDKVKPLKSKIPNTQKLSGKQVYSIFRSAQDHMWVSTTNGIDQFVTNYQRFDYFENEIEDNNVSSLGVKGFVLDQSDRIMIAVDNVGINIFDQKTGQKKLLTHDPDNSKSISSNMITDIAGGSGNDVWIATRNGLNRYNQKTSVITHFSKESKSLISNAVNVIAVSGSDKELWIGYRGKGIERLNPDTGATHHYQFTSGEDGFRLSDPWIRSLYIDKKGFVWAGTESGLNLINPVTHGIIQFLNDPKRDDSIGAGVINEIFEDSMNRLWVGTATGLSLMLKQSGEFKTLTKKDGLPGTSVMSITEDDEGFLWLGTNNGVARYWPKTGEIRSFSREDGLHGKLTNADAAIFSRDGKLFFGGTNGFNRVDPKTIVLDTFEPKVVITDFHISHKSQMPSVDGPLKNTISLAKKITLDRDQSVFSFRFAALNFFALSKVKFAYMLTGIDREWIHVASDQRFATYSHLSAGNYRFMVRATNADGIWSEHEAVINVAILPSWWETIWFRVTTIVFLILSLFGAYSWRIAFYKRQNEKLERTVEKRTEQLRQAHDKALYEARVDALTGLTNRRAFTEHSVQYIARGKRNGESFCLAMIDIDFFKEVNDNHGHEGGDKVLKAVAGVMDKTVRETDLVARVGGEEFAIIFEGVPLEMHLVAAERLRKAIESLEISTQGKTVKVTISLGITEWRNGETLDDIMRRADNALYKSKEGGRNKIVTAK